MALTFATAQTVLKEDYKDLIEQLNNDVFILAQVEKNKDSVEGLRAYHALHVSRTTGVGSRTSTGVLPAAGNQGYKQALIPIRFHYGRIQISGPVIKAMLKDSGSFIRAVESEMKGVTNDLKVDLNRQVWGTSDGVIASTGISTTTNTIVMAAGTTPTQMRQLFGDGGMVVDIGTVAAPTTIASGRLVTSVDTVNLTITVNGAPISTTAAHRIFRTGNGGATAGTNLVDDGQVELTGLQTIVDSTGIVHGVDPATYQVWKSLEDSNGGVLRSISESLINKNIQNTQLISNGAVDLLVCNAGVHRAVANTMTAMRRNIDNVALKGGYKGIAWTVAGEFDRGDTTRALKIERDCPNNSMYGLTTADLVAYEMSDNFEWMDEDGAVLNRKPDADAYEATLFKYFELAAKRRNSHFKLVDLSEA